jgi:hypothetical protein
MHFLDCRELLLSSHLFFKMTKAGSKPSLCLGWRLSDEGDVSHLPLEFAFNKKERRSSKFVYSCHNSSHWLLSDERPGDELSGRLDRNLTTSQALMLRYAFTNTCNVNDAFNNDDLSDRTARGSSFISDNSFNGTLSSTVSPAIINKFSFELAQRRAVVRTGECNVSRSPHSGSSPFRHTL